MLKLETLLQKGLNNIIEFQWTQPGMSFRTIFLKINYKAEQEREFSIRNDNQLRPIIFGYYQLEIEEKVILLYLLDNKRITRKEAVRIIGFGETKTKEIFNDLLKK